MFNISVIIPYRKSRQDDRNIIAEWCFKRYRYLFPDAEIIFCDSDDEIFSRGKSINAGVKAATGDYLVITDADYLFSPTMAKEIVNKQPWTVAVKSENYFYLNDNITNNILKLPPDVDIKKINFDNSIKTCPFTVYGGLLAMPKENFLQIQFDPNFKGYGWEDEAFYFAMKSVFGKEFRVNQKMYHMNHTRMLDGQYMKGSYKNKEYYDRVYLPIINDKKAMRKYVNNYNKEIN